MFQETVSLMLKHSDISTTTTLATVSNNTGSWTGYKNNTTWRVNLRNLMSSKMYDENEIFVLRLNQLSYSAAPLFPATSEDQQLILNVSGLNFLNGTFDVKGGNNTSKCQMVIINMGTNAQSVDYSPNIGIVNFKKSSDNVDITLELIRTVDGEIANNNGINSFPHCVYSFDIYPVK